MLVHRRELVFQAKEKFEAFGIGVGLILAGQPPKPMAAVQIATVQTLWSRHVRGDRDLPHADLIFVDEAHHVRARTYRKILESYPEARIVGMTATPTRRDGRGLGNAFEEMIEGPQVEELIALGYLVRTKVYAPSTPDLKGVRIQAGDYVEKQLAARIDTAALVGDVVEHWHRLNPRHLKTIVYATTVAHSIHICEEMVRAGIKAEHIDGQTPKDDRDATLKRLADGVIEVVVNCMVLTEGFDLPDVGCIVLARPTKSMGLYRQMVGRGLRPAPGKDHCLVLDHAGATFQHGFVEDPVCWTLEEDKKAITPQRELTDGPDHERKLLTCTECNAIRTAGKPCPNCGFMPKRRGEHLEVIDGELARLDRHGKLHPHHYTPAMKNDWQRQLLGVAMQRGYKSGWAAHQYKAKFGHWPAISNVEPMVPGPEVQSWVRSRQIAYAKAMQKAAANG